MSTIVCPKCFTKSQIKDLPWGCANSDCDREALPTTVEGTNPKCHGCHRDLTMRFCPNCGFQVFVGEDAVENLPLSIVGSEGSGKSNYLTVLINEIRHSVGRAYNCSLYPIGGDDTISQYENHYYKPLYEDGICIPSTDQNDVRPLVYSLVFNSENDGKVSTLTFYDACGANFRNERVMADYNRSIYNSRGIIFLVDPTQLPGLREEYIKRGLPVMEDDFNALLSRTIQLIRDGQNQRNLKRKIDIPISICISKLDTIRSKLDPASYLNFSSRHLQQPAFDITDHSCVNHEVQALIESWNGNDIINQVKSQFQNVGFFSFTALGSAPSEDNKITHIAPFRVVDPFLWILARNNIIKAERHTPVYKK